MFRRFSLVTRLAARRSKRGSREELLKAGSRREEVLETGSRREVREEKREDSQVEKGAP